MTPTVYDYEFFEVSFPAEYVAHVEINRPKKLNAFKQPYGTHGASTAPQHHVAVTLLEHECDTCKRMG